MSISAVREPTGFGKPKEPHTIMITRNGKTRQFIIKPIAFSVFVAVVFSLMAGYLGATTYLVFRDDLIGASYARNARMQYEYEDRIAALRGKLDRIVSRQLLDQQAIEQRVEELLLRQNSLGSRKTQMDSLIEKARANGLGGATPVPELRPDINKNTATNSFTTGSIKTGTREKLAALAGSFNLRGSVEGSSTRAIASTSTPQRKATYQPASKYTERLFGRIASEIGDIDARQREEVNKLRIAASGRSRKIAKVLTSIGVQVPRGLKANIGGPFVPLDQSASFDIHLNALDGSLKALNKVSATARALPLQKPLTTLNTSSRFGSRVDPFNGRMSMHTGTDYRAKRGTPVFSAGGGVVIEAKRNGGYGKTIKVQHRNGYTTRYAHLSRILVKAGQRINAGDVIGKVGSTGRSTGPHLHYELRKNGESINPGRYMKAGKNLKTLL